MTTERRDGFGANWSDYLRQLKVFFCANDRLIDVLSVRRYESVSIDMHRGETKMLLENNTAKEEQVLD